MTTNVTAIKQEAEVDQTLVEQVRTIMRDERITQTGLSQLTGIHKTRLSQWLNGRYAGNTEVIEADIKRWLESRDVAGEFESTLPTAPDWVPTRSAESVLSALSFAQMAGTVTVVYGGAGVGKTTAIRHYRGHYPQVWVVTATPACSSPGSLYKRIAAAIGLRTTGTMDVLEGAIIERMADTRGLLVIDEAQHLTHRALDGVRSIHDASGVGLSLVGNEVVYNQLTGGARSIGFAQLFSRIAKRVRLTRPQNADIDALLDAWGVGDKESREFCVAIAKRPGALRGLSQTLRLASMLAGSRPTIDHIRAAWADLGGDV